MVSNSKYKYLLFGGVISYIIFLLLYALFYNEIAVFKTRFDSVSYNFFYILLLSMLFLMPVIEELVFRGFFTGLKSLKIFSIVSLPLFAILANRIYLLILIIPFILILIINFKRRIIKISPYLLFVINALIFSFVHYEVKRFDSFYSIIPMISQFGIGLILIWIVINFNLIKAIVFHSLYNMMILLPLFYLLQFPDNEIKTEFKEGYKIVWSKTPVLKSNVMIMKPNDYEIKVKNITPVDVYKLFVNSKRNLEIKNYIPFQKYEIHILKRNDSSKILDSTIVKKILLNSKLIREIK